ncbi:MAG: zinc ABC transporter substrate-binding protein [Bacteroidota bacterium]
MPLLALLSFMIGAGCEEGTKARFTIVATTSMLGDAVQQIVQDKAKVITLMGPGVDPHDYKATQQDVKHLRQADVVFYNGLHLEGKMADVLHKLRSKKKVYAAADVIKSHQLRVDPEFAAGVDPHIWFSVPIWKQVVQYVSKQLQAADPDYAAYYKENTVRYLEQLTALHQKTLQAIQNILPAQRVLITAHDAFGYFGRAYNMEVRGLQGISTVSEFGLKDITDLVQFIINRNIKAIFIETSIPDKPLKAVIEGCKKRGHEVVIGGELYSDALGEAGTLEGTYHGMVQANVQTIVNALK